MEMQRHQQVQYEHDFKNHFDILALSRTDRLKHYGLHFAKYAGRLARGAAEPKSRTETFVDAFLVSLSAANALNQALPSAEGSGMPSDLEFVDHAGRFADACEKIDHLEEFRSIAVAANAHLMTWLMQAVEAEDLNIDELAEARRLQLAQRAVYSKGA